MKSLKEDGIQDIYVPRRKAAPVQAPAAPAVKTAAAPASVPADAAGDAFFELRAKALQCTLCPELCASRSSVVFGSGNPSADLVFVGEAPGRDEDEQGLPFVGAAGQLLTKIVQAIGRTREDVYICNVLKCRPPGNRPPKPEEIQNCRPYLEQQLDILKPKMICALGNFAAQTLLGTQQPMAALRGKIHDYRGIKTVCTYHPAYLLRNPEDKRKVWDDMKMMMREMSSPVS
ncbi:MAG TPA: uracil-DNA glycosylase [Verrucomicrobiae bacterium]|nr:uracil-DNA glycosylase [Verrucomicrobiae bacterium]